MPQGYCSIISKEALKDGGILIGTLMMLSGGVWLLYRFGSRYRKTTNPNQIHDCSSLIMRFATIEILQIKDLITSPRSDDPNILAFELGLKKLGKRTLFQIDKQNWSEGYKVYWRLQLDEDNYLTITVFYNDYARASELIDKLNDMIEELEIPIDLKSYQVLDSKTLNPDINS